MKVLTSDALIAALASVGLQSGDVVFVHSDLRSFGMPENQHSRHEIAQFYFDALQSVLGTHGTIATPAYFYEYARFGQTFDVERSPVSTSLGVFSQWINAHPHRRRSCNPLQSIAAIGKHAAELTGGSNLSGYGICSPWHRLRELKGKILFLGASLQAMTYVHHIEQQYGVPHLYTKIYPFPIIYQGVQLTGGAISTVRYLEFDIEYDLEPFHKELVAQNFLHTYLLNGSAVLCIEAEAAFKCGIACLSKNPYFFLKAAPKFVVGKIPTDGITSDRSHG